MADPGRAAPPVDLRQLLYFVTVAAELSFTRAAGVLRVSTPSLSQQVKALEQQLGVQLLVRDTRHVQLTPAGARFAVAARALLDAGETAVAEARALGGVLHGRLTVACLHEAEGTFEPLLTRFHAAHPGVEVSVPTLRHADLVAAVQGGAADAGLSWTFLLDAEAPVGLQWEEVTATEIVAVMGSHHPLAGLDRVRRGPALATVPVLLFERGYSPRTYDYSVEQLYGSATPFPPVVEIAVTVRAQESMVRSVLSTEAIAPVDRSLAGRLSGDLVVRPFDPPWHVTGCLLRRTAPDPPILAGLLHSARSGPAQRD